MPFLQISQAFRVCRYREIFDSQTAQIFFRVHKIIIQNKLRRVKPVNWRLTKISREITLECFVYGQNRNFMKLRILYHGNCFDGVSSAAFFTKFYQSKINPTAEVCYTPTMHRAGNAFDSEQFDG